MSSLIPQPIFFLSHSRPLYGLFCAPEHSRDDAPVVIGCHSAGLEHSSTCRMLALLARTAAGAGYPALVYHSRGHGDSAGDAADVSFETLVEDALAAADEGCKRAGTGRVIWFGVRFGCLVVAEAIQRRPGSVALALWEPLHQGAHYFRQLTQLIRSAAVARNQPLANTRNYLLEGLDHDGRVQVFGAYLYRKFYDSGSRPVLAEALAQWSGPTHVAQIQPRLKLSPENNALISTLEARGAKVRVSLIREVPQWQVPSLPWTSASLLTETGAWLNALA